MEKGAIMKRTNNTQLMRGTTTVCIQWVEGMMRRKNVFKKESVGMKDRQEEKMSD